MTAPSPAGYGTSMHWPSCADGQCTGCLPEYQPPAPPRLDPSVFRTDADPVVKYDGDGQPVHASQLAGNRSASSATAPACKPTTGAIIQDLVIDYLRTRLTVVPASGHRRTRRAARCPARRWGWVPIVRWVRSPPSCHCHGGSRR